MRIGLFGGSFDPVHSEHVRFVEAAKRALDLDRVIVMPAFSAPHKQFGTVLSGEARLSLLKIAFRALDFVTVSDYELKAGGTSYTYLTCRALEEKYPNAERFLLVGADMLENFFTWKNPQDILSRVTLVTCGRAGNRDDFEQDFFRRFGTNYLRIPFEGKSVSSTEIRVALFFGKKPEGMDGAVRGEIEKEGYFHRPEIAGALALEKEERREHSYRVALMAGKRARSLGINEEKALLASAMHDCGKYVPLSSPLLKGFVLPEGVPAPVVHQYTGAYLAEHEFGIRDEEILDAIRFHTSGKADMSPLGKLVYLADLLEAGRSFPGVEELRTLFWKDLDECFSAALLHQTAYLQEAGKPVYPLTQQALDWVRKGD